MTYLRYVTRQEEIVREGTSTVTAQIKPLSDSQAVKRGAEFIGETFIFTVGAGLLVIEYNRQASDKAESSARDKARSEMKQRVSRRA
jgi:hypothetical protein